MNTLSQSSLSPAAEIPPVAAAPAEWLRTGLRWLVDFEATVRAGIPLLHAILMGARRSNADVILRHAPCPVLCATESASPPGRGSTGNTQPSAEHVRD
ncbi:MAG TPA: hypothetical protein P5205_05505 [Candidatus Paceibacterota bacterium]|nr:hypothetical protein [Verrucomicrobiota bacterium]HSA09811.1 hypothetical protein [Candidatus Paceibacterota bacterium]